MQHDPTNGAYALYCRSLDQWAEAVRFGCNLMRASFVIRGHEEGITRWEDGGCRKPVPHREHLLLNSSASLDALAAAELARYAAAGTKTKPLPWE
ncbi:MAG: hypothetical protein V2I43_21195 [Parvularcula sp.]|jgi:hypothetical protein|nr:hypothetical protein [Parvularcula sp.]